DDDVNVDLEGEFSVAPERSATNAFETPSSNEVVIRVGTSLDLAERALIMATLRAVDGSKSKAAQVLGISLKTLYNRLHAYGAARALNAIAEADAEARLAA